MKIIVENTFLGNIKAVREERDNRHQYISQIRL